MATSDKFGGLDIRFGPTSNESKQFYSVFLALFIPIDNWIKLEYKLLPENIPILNNLFLKVWLFTVIAAAAAAARAAIPFNIVSIQAHYIHRKKRQFRIQQSIATEPSPNPQMSTPEKETDLVITIVILQLEILKEPLKTENSQIDNREVQFSIYKEQL
jgi:hypothetical protein